MNTSFPTITESPWPPNTVTYLLQYLWAQPGQDVYAVLGEVVDDTCSLAIADQAEDAPQARQVYLAICRDQHMAGLHTPACKHTHTVIKIWWYDDQIRAENKPRYLNTSDSSHKTSQIRPQKSIHPCTRLSCKIRIIGNTKKSKVSETNR